MDCDAGTACVVGRGYDPVRRVACPACVITAPIPTERAGAAPVVSVLTANFDAARPPVSTEETELATDIRWCDVDVLDVDVLDGCVKVGLGGCAWFHWLMACCLFN